MAKPKPVVVDRRPQSSVVIQMHYKERTRDGYLTQKKSRSITVHNLTLDQVHDRILKALTE